MAASEKTWLDNNPPSCDAADLNGFKNENNNLIAGSGQTVDDADNQQTHKAVAHFAAGGDWYTDSGSANAKVLAAVAPRVAPPAYFNGMRVRFSVNTTNTGATTINVASLGVKNIYIHTVALVGGELVAGMIVTLVYDGTQFNVAHIQNPDYSDMRDAAGGANDKIVRALVDSGVWTLKSLNDALTDRTTMLRADLGAGSLAVGNPTGGVPTTAGAVNASEYQVNGAAIVGAVAWVNFNGTGTVAINDSVNVTSITDHAVGDYTINFSSALPSAVYGAVFGTNIQRSFGYNSVRGTRTASAISVWHGYQSGAGGGTASDEDNLCMAVYDN